SNSSSSRYFFFQAADGIRDRNVTGVQTCALPIFINNDVARIARHNAYNHVESGGLTGTVWPQQTDNFPGVDGQADVFYHATAFKIGRASCREKSVDHGGRRHLEKEGQ